MDQFVTKSIFFLEGKSYINCKLAAVSEEQVCHYTVMPKHISNHLFIFPAYGVSSSLNVGFEEALFLANKIKSNLGSNLSTEKMLYLLFITLQRQAESKKNVNEKDVRTFRAFIIRYLYYLRE